MTHEEYTYMRNKKLLTKEEIKLQEEKRTKTVGAKCCGSKAVVPTDNHAPVEELFSHQHSTTSSEKWR
jgi:hypothetical protein